MNSKTLKLCVLGAFTFFGFATQGQTTHTVINTSDDATTPPSGSLREAAINATAGDIIRFDPVLLNSGSVTITLADEIDFSNKGVTIKGLYNATDTLYISGDNNSRIFSFSTAQPKVVLDSLVLMKGNGVSADTSARKMYKPHHCLNSQKIIYSSDSQ
jgi:hypothetical protein